MIPASYLFKDIYRREWLDPEVAIDIADARRRATPRHAFNAVTGFLRRLSPPQPRPSDEWHRTPAE